MRIAIGSPSAERLAQHRVGESEIAATRFYVFNFQIGADLAAIRFRAPETPDGEFEVRAGSCDGERIAVLPLAPARGNPALTRLVAPLPPRAAKETLCIAYTARGVNPMWGLKQVELLP